MQLVKMMTFYDKMMKMHYSLINPKQFITRSKTAKVLFKPAAKSKPLPRVSCLVIKLSVKLLSDEEYDLDENQSECYDDANDDVQEDNVIRDVPPRKKILTLVKRREIHV